MPDARTVALLASAALVVVVVLTVVVTTPWQPLDDAARRTAEAQVPVDLGRDFAPAEHAREDAYHRAVRPPAYLSMALGLLLVCVLGFTPLGARLVDAVARPVGGGWAWRVLLGGLAILVVSRLLALPLSAWVEVVQRRYGLSTRSWGGWTSDVVKSFLLSVALTLLVLVVLVALIRSMPRWWWVPAAAGAALLVVSLSFVYPLLVEPVFNRFTPMPDGALRTSLLDLAERDGVPVEEVLVADASRRTTTLNAYVSGFGATRRIVVYDTLVASVPAAQVENVVAHELGHAKSQDVLRGTVLGALGMAAAVCALGWLLSWPRLLDRAGVEQAGDGRAVALVLAVVAVLGFVGGPAGNLVSRRIEARADVHALDLTRDPVTFARMQRALAVKGLSDLDPHPVVYAMFASHPTAPERIALARTWARLSMVPEPPDLAPVRGSTG